jgi:hypothetical protein
VGWLSSSSTRRGGCGVHDHVVDVVVLVTTWWSSTRRGGRG